MRMQEESIRTLEPKAGSTAFVRLTGMKEPVASDGLGREDDLQASSVKSLLRLVHLTDVQLCDFGSPTRFEYVNRYHSLPGIGDLVPGYRPQEFLVAAALTQFVDTINSLEASQDTGAELDLVVTTGDIIDNAQANEFVWATTILGGGRVNIGDTIAKEESVHSGEWGDSSYWDPESPDNDFHRFHSFPIVPGIVESASCPLTSPGLRVPWIAVNGNHEVLIQGVGPVTERVSEIAYEGRKTTDIPSNTALYSEAAFIASPGVFFDSAPAKSVTPRGSRQTSGTRRAVVEAYLKAPGQPFGHGFSRDNLATDTAYYWWSASDRIVFVGLDTAQPAGGAAGAIDDEQLRWLSRTLKDLCSYRYEQGVRVTSGSGHDPYIILLSHHPLVTIQEHGGITDRLLDTLGQYPQVIAWLSGHTHANKVLAHASSHFDGGFFEITTCSVMDWPSEVRVIEVVETSHSVELHCEMRTHSGPSDPGETLTLSSLASWHRVLSANTVSADQRVRMSGRPIDRNVNLRLTRHP